MKTLVIHPKDITTDFLSEIYSDINCDIYRKYTSKEDLLSQIKSHDEIIMLGHGSENGLFELEKLIIDSTFSLVLKEKKCTFVWCNADVFVKKNNLSGLCTGMIISEYEEALIYGISNFNQSQIDESNILFASSFKELQRDKIVEKYNIDNTIVEFNKQNIFYI